MSNLIQKSFYIFHLMRKIFVTYIILLFLLGCKTEELQNPPTVITKGASNITLQNATINGEVTDEGFSATTERGFVMSDKKSNPSVSDSKIQAGYGKGGYSYASEKLAVNTKYYYKAYATNIKGTAYGEVQIFTTADYNLASLTTDVPKSVGYTTVNLGGIIINDGGGFISERGFVIGTNPTPTVLDLKLTALSTGIGAFSLFVSTLKESTKYYVRSYALNEKGISYGNTHYFTTADFTLPSVITEKALLFTYNAVKLEGAVTNDGGTKIVESGICYGLNSNPKVSDFKVLSSIHIGSFVLDVIDLRENTTYYFRAFAMNSKGLTYGNELFINTLSAPTK
jgi:hypothetical protein